MSSGGSAPSELRAQVALAIPLAAQQLGFQLMGLVDAAWLGRYSDTALAAAGIGNNLLFAITSIGLGIVMGLDTVIPQAIGAGRVDDARRFLHAGLRIAVLIGLASTLVVIATPPGRLPCWMTPETMSPTFQPTSPPRRGSTSICARSAWCRSCSRSRCARTWPRAT